MGCVEKYIPNIPSCYFHSYLTGFKILFMLTKLSMTMKKTGRKQYRLI